MIKTKILLFVFIALLVSVSTLRAEEGGYIHINYGISSHSTSFVSHYGAPTIDDDDLGFMLSGGVLIGPNWGVDAMYYDLGKSSIKGDASDIFEIDGSMYQFKSTGGGTVSHSTDGYGVGVIGFMSPDEGFMNAFAKFGLHNWDRSGSTTLLTDNTNINSRFYDDGIDLYAGFGVDFNVIESIGINASYDILGFGDDASIFTNTSTLLSLGITATF